MASRHIKRKKKTIILSYVNWLHYIYEQAYMVSLLQENTWCAQKTHKKGKAVCNTTWSFSKHLFLVLQVLRVFVQK